jgi:hypothetical protein
MPEWTVQVQRTSLEAVRRRAGDELTAAALVQQYSSKNKNTTLVQPSSAHLNRKTEEVPAMYTSAPFINRHEWDAHVLLRGVAIYDQLQMSDETLDIFSRDRSLTRIHDLYCHLGAAYGIAHGRFVCSSLLIGVVRSCHTLSLTQLAVLSHLLKRIPSKAPFTLRTVYTAAKMNLCNEQDDCPG